MLEKKEKKKGEKNMQYAKHKIVFEISERDRWIESIERMKILNIFKPNTVEFDYPENIYPFEYNFRNFVYYVIPEQNSNILHFLYVSCKKDRGEEEKWNLRALSSDAYKWNVERKIGEFEIVRLVPALTEFDSVRLA
ncbi:MAG: hypothetical protein LUF68_08560 [Clostridiales bacterium]|nr:hypothetical protein [Clostridiales bacterium]